MTGRSGSRGALKTGKDTRFDKPKMHKVILLNDDFTPMQFVVEILVSVFNKGYSEAVALMLTVHNQGKAVCGEYPKEIADTKAEITMSIARSRGYPLQAVVE